MGMQNGAAKLCRHASPLTTELLYKFSILQLSRGLSCVPYAASGKYNVIGGIIQYIQTTKNQVWYVEPP